MPLKKLLPINFLLNLLPFCTGCTVWRHGDDGDSFLFQNLLAHGGPMQAQQAGGSDLIALSQPQGLGD
jgi:hypothetical protein